MFITVSSFWVKIKVWFIYASLPPEACCCSLMLLHNHANKRRTPFPNPHLRSDGCTPVRGVIITSFDFTSGLQSQKSLLQCPNCQEGVEVRRNLGGKLWQKAAGKLRAAEIKADPPDGDADSNCLSSIIHQTAVLYVGYTFQRQRERWGRGDRDIDRLELMWEIKRMSLKDKKIIQSDRQDGGAYIVRYGRRAGRKTNGSANKCKNRDAKQNGG